MCENNFTNAMLLTDGYKLDHRRQYPEGTEYVYSNWTPRSNKFMPDATDGVVVFGIQYFIKKWLIETFKKEFFDIPEEEAVKTYTRRVNSYLGPNGVGEQHIRDLHKLGYLPIRIKALPEGSICPIRCPMLTIVNTDPKFFWITNFLETLMSCELWLPMTSATTARLYRKNLEEHAKKTGFPKDVSLGFLCHDFSMRGMQGVESAIISGMGYMTSFYGSETLPAIGALEKYYGIDAENQLISSTIAATEHSVMCAGSKEDEFETYKRLITEVYPNGFVSIVSDTWDLWKVMTDYLPRLKDIILARDGRVVIRPDSGTPEDIIAGIPEDELVRHNGKIYHIKNKELILDPDLDITKLIDANTEEYEKYVVSEAEVKGVYELLWDLFGGYTNEKGYKILDSHVGALYGDSITRERQLIIYDRLEKKGFAATNQVLGVGSYSLCYVTRDCLGFAMKATWCQVNGEGREIFKDPVTDSGVKKSLKGLIRVNKLEGQPYTAVDQVSKLDEMGGCLETVFENGKLVKEYTFAEIRNRLWTAGF